MLFIDNKYMSEEDKVTEIKCFNLFLSSSINKPSFQGQWINVGYDYFDSLLELYTSEFKPELDWLMSYGTQHCLISSKVSTLA